MRFLFFLCVQVLEKEPPEAVKYIWDVLGALPDGVPETDWRFASPKSLLDNFYRTMRCLFSDCFASQDTQKDCEYTVANLTVRE